MRTSILHPGTFKLDGGAMFGIIPKPLWEKKIKADEFNRILMSLRVVLFQTTNHNILVDTGIGDYHADKFRKLFEISSENQLLSKALASAGLKTHDITDVVLTHLHFDHVGGLGTKEGELVFPKARVHVHKEHYKYALSPSARDKGSFHAEIFSPLLDKSNLNLLEGDEGDIIKDGEDVLKFKRSFGHTPHMIHPFNDKYIYMADLVPMAHHVPVPWVMGYDIEPAVTTQYKEKFFEFITQKNLTMIFEHDNETWGGTLSSGDGKLELDASPSKKDAYSITLP